MSSFKKSLRENFKIIFATLAFELPIFASGGLFYYLICSKALSAVGAFSSSSLFALAGT